MKNMAMVNPWFSSTDWAPAPAIGSLKCLSSPSLIGLSPLTCAVMVNPTSPPVRITSRCWRLTWPAYSKHCAFHQHTWWASRWVVRSPSNLLSITRLRLRTLTIVNSGPSLGGTPEEARQEIERRVGIVQQLGMRAMGEALAPALFPNSEQATLRETFVKRWAENDPRAYIEATRSLLGWNVEDQLGTIKCPTLILAADQDYTPVATKEAYVKLIPHARLVVIPEAHHATPIEKPEKFNAALKEFLDQNR